MDVKEVMAAIQQAFFSRFVSVFVHFQELNPCSHGWFPITVEICIQVEPCGNIWMGKSTMHAYWSFVMFCCPHFMVLYCDEIQKIY